MVEMPKDKPRTFGIPTLLVLCHWVTAPTSTHPLFLPLCPKIQLSLKLNAKGKLEALHACVCERDSMVCLCVRYATSEGPLRILVYLVMTMIWFIHYFRTAVFTDSPSPSPVPYPPVWRPHPPPQSFAPWQMFPAPSPVGYNPYRVEQHPGVYVCEYMWGMWRGVCVWCHQDGDMVAI